MSRYQRLCLGIALSLVSISASGAAPTAPSLWAGKGTIFDSKVGTLAEYSVVVQVTRPAANVVKTVSTATFASGFVKITECLATEHPNGEFEFKCSDGSIGTGVRIGSIEQREVQRPDGSMIRAAAAYDDAGTGLRIMRTQLLGNDVVSYSTESQRRIR